MRLFRESKKPPREVAAPSPGLARSQTVPALASVASGADTVSLGELLVSVGHFLQRCKPFLIHINSHPARDDVVFA